METTPKILVVEDDMIIAANISLQLTNLGYEVVGIESRGEAAIRHVEENKPDIVLLDINLKGTIDGVETAHAIHSLWDIPVIYVTANTDEATFERAKKTRPEAFIHKPIRNIDLQRAIELTVSRLASQQPKSISLEPELIDNEPFILSDRIFVRHKDKMIKIVVQDILYVEADRNYCHIYTKAKEYMLSTSLKQIEDKLPAQHFLRIHRSFLVNLLHIDEVAENHLIIGQKAIPLSQHLRTDLLKRIQTI